MSITTRIDRAGRLVIPKELRDRYGLGEGAEVEVVATPDGISLIPTRTQRTIIRRGRIVAIQTRTDAAPLEAFSVDESRDDRLDRATGRPEPSSDRRR